jgi:two-component system, NarL family, sensor histidine kinase UhpB
VRHSGANGARVEVRLAGERVVASVVDGGRGFSLDTRRARGGGLGLVGMQERAAMIGGHVWIESAPGEGTRVRLEVPTVRAPGAEAKPEREVGRV